MAIATEITRLQAAKSGIKAAIAGKGVTVPDAATIDAYAQYIDSIPSGGQEQATAEIDDVTYIDYDGTVVATYSASEFAELASHPANPDRTTEGLTAQGWNWSLADAKAYVAKYGSLCIGQSYITTDGATRIKIDTRLAPKLFTQEFNINIIQSVSQGVLIDWGDGSSERVDGINVLTVPHTYAKEGVYTISLLPDENCTLQPTNNSGSRSLFGYSNASPEAIARCSAITEMHIGKNVTIATVQSYGGVIKISIPEGVTQLYGANNAYDLEAIVLPSGCRTVVNTFGQCSSLRFISFPSVINQTGFSMVGCRCVRMLTFPEGVTTIGSADWNGLERVALPDTLTTFEANSAMYMQFITKLVIPEGVTSIGNSSFQRSALRELDLPSTITTLGNSVAAQPYEKWLERIIIRAVTPPTITSSSLSSTNNCPIYVPDDSVDAYKAASNWSALASRIKPLSEFVEA